MAGGQGAPPGAPTRHACARLSSLPWELPAASSRPQTLPAFVPLQEGWRARALFAFRLLFSWPARLLRRAGCPPYAVSTHAHLRSFAAALLGTLVWQLFLGGGGWAASFWGDWAASFPAASLWLAMALCVACWAALSWVLKHNLLQSRQELDALTGHKNAMLDKRNELSADAPSLARLANAAFIVLEGRAARAQQALQAAEAGQQGLRLWG